MTVVSEALRSAALRGFGDRFGGAPEGIAFAPGRVNLIGEHVDYCGLPVLPAAVAAGLAIAFRRAEAPRIRCQSSGFGEVEFPTDAPPVTGFGRYLGAAVTGLECGAWIEPDGRGFDGVIAADLPAASGLSSSSALVVAGALALLAVNRRLAWETAALPVRMARCLAPALAEAEHGVAISGGAMDQSVCLGARAGHALFIEFEPPAWTPVPVDPERFAFLTAFTGERADKGGAAGVIFDRRVEQANAAIAQIGRQLRDPGPFPALLRRHRADRVLEAGRGLPDPLDRRLRHVVREAERTREARRCLEGGDLRRLGALLDASHESLQADYEVSTPELDALVRAARRAGAAGARLTGAGLGGSIVIACRPDQAAVREQLVEGYYGPRGIAGAERTHILDATPAAGARIEWLPG